MQIIDILIILGGHYIADFLFQTRNTGVNKSTDNWILTEHIGTYMLVMIPFMFIVGLPLEFVWINGAAHWITDYITSRLTSHFYKSNNMTAFWHTIGLDQLLHTGTLLVTANYMLS